MACGQLNHRTPCDLVHLASSRLRLLMWQYNLLASSHHQTSVGASVPLSSYAVAHLLRPAYAGTRNKQHTRTRAAHLHNCKHAHKLNRYAAPCPGPGARGVRLVALAAVRYIDAGMHLAPPSSDSRQARLPHSRPRPRMCILCMLERKDAPGMTRTEDQRCIGRCSAAVPKTGQTGTDAGECLGAKAVVFGARSGWTWTCGRGV